MPNDAWSGLQAELDRWRGPPLRFWWRDDDAIDDTPQIRHLLNSSARLGVPLAVAVIPAHVSSALPMLLRDRGDVAVLAHGWSHRNRARPGQLAAEFASGRDRHETFAELCDSRRVLEDLFGGQSLPVQVPPFNRIAPNLVPEVVRAGYRYISIDRDFTGLTAPSCNVHIDVVDWAFHCAADATTMVRSTVAAIRLRRYGLVDPSQPIGLMTHHLVHDTATWAMTERLLRELSNHDAVVFPRTDEIFPRISSP